MAMEYVKSFSFVKMNVSAETLFDLVFITSFPSSYMDYYVTCMPNPTIIVISFIHSIVCSMLNIQ